MASLLLWLPVVSVLLLFAARILELRQPRTIQQPGIIHERTTLKLFAAAGGLMLAGSLWEFAWNGRPVRSEFIAAGLVCAIASFAIRQRAVQALGALWSLHVEIREDHLLVQAGPFRWTRHPIYLSMILEMVAAGLILNAPIALAAASLFFVPALWIRLKVEESALVGKFGDRYRSYQATTPALIPYKWPPTK